MIQAQPVVKHIYVSPHSDDVALSCGGQIIGRGTGKDDVLVLNIFTSEIRGAEEFESRLFDSINSERTSEDKSAWDSVGIRTAYANLPEALLRNKFPFRIVRRGDDESTFELLHETIKSYVVAHPEATFYFPAGFGNHVDHLACKEIAFRLLDEGALTRVVLYEDVPYSWLRFIRTESYRALLQTVVLNEESREKAFRRDGEDFLRYIRSRMVPFPRGKTLFALVSASLILKNILSKSWRTLRKYSGEIRITELNDDQISKKAELLFHYESQIPMLFGEAPEELLHALHESFSREVTIEVTRLRSCA